jgi:hypothetical protein
VKGEHNVVADALSRIHIMKEEENASGQEMAYCMSRLTRNKAIKVPEPTSPQDMATCFAGSEDVEFEQFPMKPVPIAHEQAKDKKLQKKIRESRRDYTIMKVVLFQPREGSTVINGSFAKIAVIPVIAVFAAILANLANLANLAICTVIYIVKQQIAANCANCRKTAKLP